MKPILTDALYPPEIGMELQGLSIDFWADKIKFWDKCAECEPDIIIELDDAVILIEVKLFSGLSSDDDVDNSGAIKEDYGKSSNQLQKYADRLTQIAGERKRYLILLAPLDSAHHIYADVKQRNLIDSGIEFGYMTWQGAYDVLFRLSESEYHQLIIDDLLRLLRVKGLRGFSSFKIDTPISDSLVWEFGAGKITLPAFAFEQSVNITEGDFYVFK
jgi:hypothetical protein